MKSNISSVTCLLAAPLLTVVACANPAGSAASQERGYEWLPVEGTGVHYFSTAIEHSRQPTATGEIVRSTDTVELTGDLNGRVLYHPISVFDYAAGTLVNTGHQVFSGTVLGVGPVMLFDDSFRFEVNLFTGETTGEVLLNARLAGKPVRCELTIVGTGQTEEEDSTLAYSGSCRVPTE